jgi:DNA-binding NtrC family response regulator
MNAEPSGTPAADLHPATVLVVEDEVLVRMVVADALREAGYHVLEAANAEEAMALLASFSEIALVLTDIQMPGTMDGVGLARFIRSTHPALTVIVTSGAAPRPNGDAAIHFVAKPYNLELLAREVRRALERAKIRPSTTEAQR